MKDKDKNDPAADESSDEPRGKDHEAAQHKPDTAGEVRGADDDDTGTADGAMPRRDADPAEGQQPATAVAAENGDGDGPPGTAAGEEDAADTEADTLAMVKAAMESGSREAKEAKEAEASADKPPEPPPPQAPPPKRSSGVAWLALLLVLGLGGAAGWYYQQTQLREAALLERLAHLEDAAEGMNVPAPPPEGFATEQALTAVATQASRLDSRTRELESLLQELRNRPEPEAPEIPPAQTIDTEALTREWDSRLADALSRVEAANRRQQQQLQSLSSEVEVLAQQPQVNIDRDAWQLAEVEYLLRLANQRMIMAGDTRTAGALLASADGILRELDDIAMLDARRALAEDLAAVRAVPRLDVEGMYLKLAALIRQADALVIFELPDTLESVEPVAPETWQERLAAGWQRALQTLSSYIVVRRRDTPMEALMDPQWERMVRQNLRMLLEQSQAALLSGNQVLFEESLQRTLYWVEEFFVSDEAAARALHADLSALMEQTIAVELPDIAGSMLAFDRAMARKLALSEGAD